jgi:hypothetical protein
MPALPGRVLPGRVLPGRVLPGRVLPGRVLPGRVLASPADRLLELRIELESQIAFSRETKGLEFKVQIP